MEVYKLELDILSGGQNPQFEIGPYEFMGLFHTIEALEESATDGFFDGLGFRGFVLSKGERLRCTVQKTIIKIEEGAETRYKRGDPGLIRQLFELVRKYDPDKRYGQLIAMAAKDYRS
ncbi:hypothetical protein SAMN05421766_104424 [Zobellia uliginosa]|uniref:Uncharacterized protein n=1 Tax=Zobellia uliginosa TaxID=143224 RepID=A0ABY1L0T7_9FLAO|nr:hypothetical protein [Zobellia uliginosa]SIS85826.1 hypothetical protein SAMN05421766_104424 [Zobellia uliginosa]